MKSLSSSLGLTSRSTFSPLTVSETGMRGSLERCGMADTADRLCHGYLPDRSAAARAVRRTNVATRVRR